jgi:invasion protein IalB
MVYKLFKSIFFVSSFLIYLTTYSLSEITSKAWSAECSKDKKRCIAVIINEIKNKDKNQTLATAYIQITSSKLSEENKNIPLLFVKLPLNADLKKNPAVLVDNKKLGDLRYTHCNGTDGCVTNVAINNDVIQLFKKGKTMTVVMGIYGNAKNMNIEFPLKNFSRSYAQLTKK